MHSGDLGHSYKKEKDSSETIFGFILAAAIFLSYGFEIFNFNLTIDEEVHALNGAKWNEWIAQGRWGMAFLNYFLLPHPITPVVSTFLGVVGTAIGITLLLKRIFKLDNKATYSISALAITTPTLPFTIAFSTLSYGVGFGFLALAISNFLIYQRTWQSLIVACVLGGFTLGIYQTFVFALVILVIIHAWDKHSDAEEKATSRYKCLAIYLLGSVFAYFVFNFLALKVSATNVIYVGQFIDIAGFFQNPIQRTVESIGRVSWILSLDRRLFGIQSLWLSLVILSAIFFLILFPLLNKNYRVLKSPITAVILILLVIIGADAIAAGGAPLRSVIYIPIGIAAIVAYAYAGSGELGRRILIVLCFLAVIGNSQINNHLFASSASAEFKDRLLAASILNESRLLALNKNEYSVLKIEVIGNLSWPATGIQSKTETFGASFFEWDGGNRHRVAAYLNINGLAAVAANEKDRAQIYKAQATIPAWPHEGWISMVEDVLVLKFGEYSAAQKASLCAQGIEELCD